MKRTILILALVALMLAGCNGVVLNAEYSKLLDQTTDLSAATAVRAQDGTLPAGDMRDALIYQAYVWKQFKNGRDGVKSDPIPTVAPNGITDLLKLAPATITQPK